MSDTLDQNVPAPITEEPWLHHFRSLHSIEPTKSIKKIKKLEFYKTFKDEYFTSDHLYQLRHYDERQHFVKFKISNNKIMIEQG